MGFYKLEIDELKSFDLEIRKGKEHVTLFNLKNNEWVFDRSHSGVEIKGRETDYDSNHGIRRMPYIKNKHHEIYLVLDEFSFEVFIDGRSMTSLIYPDLEDDLLNLKIAAKQAVLYKYFDK